jgi:hypothetical protein
MKSEKFASRAVGLSLCQILHGASVKNSALTSIFNRKFVTSKINSVIRNISVTIMIFIFISIPSLEHLIRLVDNLSKIEW